MYVFTSIHSSLTIHIYILIQINCLIKTIYSFDIKMVKYCATEIFIEVGMLTS